MSATLKNLSCICEFFFCKSYVKKNAVLVERGRNRELNVATTRPTTWLASLIKILSGEILQHAYGLFRLRCPDAEESFGRASLSLTLRSPLLTLFMWFTWLSDLECSNIVGYSDSGALRTMFITREVAWRTCPLTATHIITQQQTHTWGSRHKHTSTRLSLSRYVPC